MEWVSWFPPLSLLEDSHWNETPWKNTHTFPNPFYISTQLHHIQAINWHFHPSFRTFEKWNHVSLRTMIHFLFWKEILGFLWQKKSLYSLNLIQNLQYNMPSYATGNRKVLEKQNSERNQFFSLDETEWGNCLVTALTYLNIRFYFLIIIYLHCMCMGALLACV